MKITVRVDGETYQVEVGDLYARPVTAQIDGQVFEVWPEGVAPFEIKTAPQKLTPIRVGQPKNGVGAPAHRAVLAPIPGVIFMIHVQPGDEVETGQPICVLEAMKMKNVIRAPHAGRIAAVQVQPGQQVATGTALVLFDS